VGEKAFLLSFKVYFEFRVIRRKVYSVLITVFLLIDVKELKRL